MKAKNETQEPNNPASLNRKRRTLRQLDVTERLKIVKLLASRSRTYQEVADTFNVKVQLVRDLNKDLKAKQVRFINKRKVEIRKVIQQAAITKSIQNAIDLNESIWNVK